MTFRVRRGAVVATLLVLALVVAGMLAVQAYGVARYHRAQADRVLRDYAALAAARVAQRTALGFEPDPAALTPLVVHATEKFPLLPRPLTGGVQYDSMGSIIITDRYGVELYRSAVQYQSPFSARDTIGTDMGDLYARATLRASVADQLIIGGLPRSRLPLILGLLAVTAVLIGTALLPPRP